MYGLFTVGTQQVFVAQKDLERVIEIGEAFPFPGKPNGVKGLIEVNDSFVPLVEAEVVIEQGENLSKPVLTMAAILRLHGERFAISIDDVVGLHTHPETNEDGSPPLILDGEAIWNRVLVLNEGE